MQFVEPIPPRNTELEAAIRLLESHPEYLRVVLLMRKRLADADKKRAHIDILGRQVALEWVSERLEIRAETLGELVYDTATLNAYKLILQWFLKVAWEEEFRAAFPGGGYVVSEEGKKDLRSLRARMDNAVTAIYQGLVDLDQERARDSASGPTAEAGRTAPVLPGVLYPDDGNGGNRQAGDRTSNVPEPALVVSANPAQAQRYPRSTQQATGWGEIEIWVLSDFKVEIKVGQKLEVCNYGDLGLEDRRKFQPNEVWRTLLSLAECKGNIRGPGDAQNWRTMEKRIQKLRGFLRQFFNLSEDPLPFAKGNGYRARFSIQLRPSYDT